MSIEKTRAHVIGSIWQAIAQSGVDLSTIPQEEQEKLVAKITDTVLVTVNTLLEETAEPIPAEAPDEEKGEKTLWEGRPFLSLVERYVVTTERVKIIHGMLARGVENFELIRIQDLDLKQGVSERLMGIGDVTIRGHDASDPEIVLRNVSHPEEVYETLRHAWLDARKRYGLQFREYM